MADATSPNDLRHEAEVVAEHLPESHGYVFDATSDAGNIGRSSTPDSNPPGEISSLKLPGGDIHRDVFKTAARVKMHKRAATFHHPGQAPNFDEDDLMSVGQQMGPGGFRRAYIQQKQQHLAARMPVTRNFVEFLDLYGSFAGEDLADSDDEAVSFEDDEEAAPGAAPRPATETRPLLGRRRSTRAPKTATAGTTKTFFTLLKAFIGTGIMFLPKAFSNGGILFSSITMILVAAISMLSFHLLLACKTKYSGGYGELGHAIAGTRMRGLILTSITLSQLGFVCAGIVFVAENILSFLAAVSRSGAPLSTTSIIVIQILILIPFAWIRNISKLGPAALFADICIMIGLGYIYYYDVAKLATDGMAESVVLFNPDRYTLMIGSAIFTFEGIGLILPIQSSMAKPEKFEYLLGGIMLIITIIFTSVGALCYATFGGATGIEIINNYPQTNKFVNAVQFLYSLAVLVGNPVQLFPAIRIMEGKFFGHHSGKKSLTTKWIKNLFRASMVLICGLISIVGASSLDRFVALIGSFACVPLVYIYPPYLHYRGIATTRAEKIGDIVLMMLGLVCMVYTTIVTLVNSFL
ncbi:vacuolar amino acid transporter 5 [Apiospora rasikravindrae]|uniref:Vacuolar amino acid transporter 5 n=1 Tax=Apiospora rasikravindrae TaxID=990691 RepID=A0ABR1RNU2_9PEZI